MTYQPPITVSRSDESIRAILHATYPDYRGRKVRVCVTTDPVDVRSYWQDGSRDYFVMLDLRHMVVLIVPQNGTPFDGGPIRPEGVDIPPGYAIVEHSIWCGKDMGIRIHVHPQTMPRFLKEG